MICFTMWEENAKYYISFETKVVSKFVIALQLTEPIQSKSYSQLQCILSPLVYRQ